MAETYPDQYAFKYPTLDYTRTYEQFRRDVDECAAALISLGVKAGDHVAIWATNVPAWYITFWATVKIGADNNIRTALSAVQIVLAALI